MSDNNISKTGSNALPRIASFAVDHDTLTPGIYISRRDGDCVTYDLRMRRPNRGDYMTPLAMHSLEHMLATYLRGGELSPRVIYVGPMGCRTGFYLIVRAVEGEGETQMNATVLSALRAALGGIASHSGGMPGAHRRECGNYRALSVASAKREAERYLAALDCREQSFRYNEAQEPSFNGGDQK